MLQHIKESLSLWECFIVEHSFSSLNVPYLYLQLCSQASAVFQGHRNSRSWTQTCTGEFGSVSKVWGRLFLFIFFSLFEAEVCACIYIDIYARAHGYPLMCATCILKFQCMWTWVHAYIMTCEHYRLLRLITAQSEFKCLKPFHFHVFLYTLCNSYELNIELCGWCRTLINVCSMLFVVDVMYCIYPMLGAFTCCFVSILKLVVSNSLLLYCLYMQGDLRGFCKHIVSVYGPLSG